MATTKTLTGDLEALVDDVNFATLRVWITFDQPRLTDPDTGKTKLGAIEVIRDEDDATTFTADLPDNSWDPSPHWFRVHVQYRTLSFGDLQKWVSREFQMDVDKDLAALPTELPRAVDEAEYATFFDLIDQATAARVAAVDAQAAAEEARDGAVAVATGDLVPALGALGLPQSGSDLSASSASAIAADTEFEGTPAEAVDIRVAGLLDPAIDAEVARADATYTTPASVVPIAEAAAADAIADNPEVIDAAAARALSTANVALTTDYGIPFTSATVVTANGVTYDEVTLTQDDRLVRGRAAGTPATAKTTILDGGTTETGQLNQALAVTVMGSQKETSVYTEHYLGPDGNVPQWILDRWGSRMGATATAAPVDLVLMLGQSKATKRSSLPATLYTITPRIVRWTGAAWTTESGVPWLGSGVARGLYQRDVGAALRRVGIVECAVGSTGFSSTGSAPGHWQHGVTGTGPDLATAAVTKALAALAASPAGSRIVAVIWSQGEQDRPLLPATYQAYLDDLISWFRTQVSLPELPWLLTSLTPQLPLLDPDAGKTAIMNDNLEDTPRRVVNTSYMVGPDDSEGIAGDALYGIHWSPEGAHRCGQALILGPGGGQPSALDVALLNRADAAPRTPQGLTISRSGDQAVLTWLHPTTRVTSYVLETSTNSGSSWTTQTLTSAATHRHTMTVAAGTPLWARIAAVSPTGTSYPSTEVHA